MASILNTTTMHVLVIKKGLGDRLGDSQVKLDVYKIVASYFATTLSIKCDEFMKSYILYSIWYFFY